MERILAVSIIITVHNVERYIESTLTSLMEQAFTDFEVLLVDTRSTDRTVDICRRIAQSNTRIRLIEISHSNNARQAGLAQARGKYVYIIEGDSLLMNNALALLYREAEASKADVVHSTMFLERTEIRLGEFDRNLRIKSDKIQRRGLLTSDRNERMTLGFINGELEYLTGLNMYRRSFLENHIEQIKNKFDDDQLFFLSLLSIAEKIHCFESCFYIRTRRLSRQSQPTESLQSKFESKKPVISVVVPMYNVEKYVEDSIRSVLGQTFSDFEIIIVDDCSTDGSYEICRRLSHEDSRIKLFRHEKNEGQGSARNMGMKKAHGKYIYFFDSDDILLPNALDILYGTAEKTGAEVVHTTRHFSTFPISLNEPPNQLHLRQERMICDGFLPVDNDIRFSRCFIENDQFAMTPMNLFRRDFLERNKIDFPKMVQEDEPFMFAVYCFVKKFYCIPDAFYVYRFRTDSTMVSRGSKSALRGVSAFVTGYKHMRETIARVSPEDLSPKLANECIQSHFLRLINFHIMKYYNLNNITDAEVIRDFTKALQFTLDDEVAEWSAYLIQGLVLQSLSKISLQNELNRLKR